eukprot:snap_masked-scaffold_61-processed-gene-0.27-mRNA-1 protein AED:1.00 eAED:1.00 QI:0/0/0/0/1/1/2/0/77
MSYRSNLPGKLAFTEHSTAGSNRKLFVDLANLKGKNFIHAQQEKKEIVWIDELDNICFRLKEVIVGVSKRFFFGNIR